MPRSYHWAIATQHLRQRPWSALRICMTLALCTVLLSMCIGVALQLLQRHHEHGQAATMSLFLKEEIDAKAASDFASDLMKDAMISAVDIETPDSLRSYFQDRYGVNVAEVLPQNPFPHVLKVHCKPEFLTAENFVNLVQQFRGMNTIVEDVNYQSDYVRAVIQERGVLLWSFALGGTLLLITVALLLSFVLRAEGLYTAEDRKVALLLGSSPGFLWRSSAWRHLVCALIGIGLGAGTAWILMILGQNSELIRTLPANQLSIAAGSSLVLVLVLLFSRSSLPKAR